MPENTSPADRSLRAKLAAHRLHSQYDSRDLAKPARAALNKRFEDEVDPDRILSEDERRRRAEHLKKAYFIELAIKSAKARKSRLR